MRRRGSAKSHPRSTRITRYEDSFGHKSRLPGTVYIPYVHEQMYEHGTDPESANRRFAACPTALLLYRATRPRNAPTHTYRRANNYNLLEERSNGGGGGGGGAGGGGSR